MMNLIGISATDCAFATITIERLPTDASPLVARQILTIVPETKALDGPISLVIGIVHAL